MQSGGREIFVTTSVDKARAYVDEQITLSFKFYRRISLWEQPRYTPPELSGFWSEDMPPQQEYYESVNGVRYQVTEIKTALFGTAPGKATVGAAALDYTEGGGFGFFSSPGRSKRRHHRPDLRGGACRFPRTGSRATSAAPSGATA